MKSPLKWYGGKGMIASWIVSHFPPHSIYVEPFGGGASVLFAKEPVGVEVYNDLNYDVCNFFETLREDGEELIRKLTLMPYHEAEFGIAQERDRVSYVDQAARNFVIWRQSFAGKGKNWSYTTRRSRRGMANNVSAWLSAVEGLPEAVERLRRVEFHSTDALQLIPKFSTPEALIYCDPPYVHDTRTSDNDYTYEMTQEQHIALAEILNASQAKVCLSGYPSDLYNDLYKGWRTVSKSVANHAAGGSSKRRMQETLWMNYP